MSAVRISRVRMKNGGADIHIPVSRAVEDNEELDLLVYQLARAREHGILGSISVVLLASGDISFAVSAGAKAELYTTLGALEEVKTSLMREDM